MKKPEITIQNYGEFGPDALEMKITKNRKEIATFLYQHIGEGEIITDMIDALIEAHELILHQLKFEDEENMKKVLEYKKGIIESALKKAGAQL